MDAIEQAIRNAFAKGNPEDPAFREKVYRWAYSVVDKAIIAKPELSPEDADRQRRRVLESIKTVEQEFQPAADLDPPAAGAPVAESHPQAPAVPPNVEPEPVVPGVPEARDPVVPSIALESHDAHAPASDWPDLEEAQPRRSSSGSRLAGDPDLATPRGTAPAAGPERSRRRLPLGFITGLLILAIVAGLAFWAAAELGIVGSPSGSQPAAQTDGTTAPGAPVPPGEENALEDWIVVFSPDDPTSVTTPSGASAEVIGSGEEQAMRISSGADGTAVVFDIGQGVLERIAGRRAIFDIVARTGEGPETQMSVTCSLGDLGECGRNRYQVGKERTEYLFEIDVPDRAPGSAGSIAITSDVDNGGKAVEILEIRVTTAASQ